MSTWKNYEVSRWMNFVQEFLLPSTCIACGRSGQPGLDLCPGCKATLPQVDSPCRGCGLPLPPQTGSAHCGGCLQSTNAAVSRTVTAFAYQDAVKGLIGRFKYERKLHLGKTLTRVLAEIIEHDYQQEPLPELLIPVPLHDTRLRQRGYNQAQLIALDLRQQLRIPLASNLVHRTRVTPAQQGLRAHERKRNLRGAFVAADDWQTMNCSRVALVDDVVTTMSTVREIARVLRHGKSVPPEVHVWCLARA